MRVGARIHRERAQRWRTRTAFAQATGVSVRLLVDLENGKRTQYRAETLASVERMLGWAPGEIEASAEGGAPRRRTDRDLTRLVNAWPRLSPRDRRTLLAVAEQLLSD